MDERSDTYRQNIFLTNVFNTDPEKIREAGHYLYSYFDIPQSLAIVTGSGAVVDGTEKELFNGNKLLDCAFLVTSSVVRNAGDTAGSLSVPNFENFSDRFQAAKSPFIISQYLDRQQFNLFRFHALDDGEIGNTQLKVTIKNIRPPESDDLYGKFDVVVRSLDNTDVSFAPISGSEEFLNCDLNPSSDNYIARMIGDQHYYYDFDKPIDRQRFVKAGEHENKSTLLRVEMAKAIEQQTLPIKTLPVGYRGFGHLVTSGSSIMSCPQHPLSDGSVIQQDTEWANKIVEPPIPYRIRISGEVPPPAGGAPTGERQLDGELSWGVQTTRFHTVARPNENLNLNESIKSYSKYYPSFTTNRQHAFVDNNVGAEDSGGTVYDVDRFNNNIFTLENILIHTKSKTEDIIDPEQWQYTKYSRDRKPQALLDKTLKLRSGTRFFDISKDLTNDNTTQVSPYLSFTFIVQGGFDGTNMFVKEKRQFMNLAAYYEMEGTNQGRKSGPVVAAYLKALNMLSDKSETDIKLLALPGIRTEAITAAAIATAEERFDTFYVMDLEEVSTEGNVITSDSEEPSPSLTSERFKSRALDSSFAAAYFPDVSMVDPASRDGNIIFAPPSISVLRTFGRLAAEGNIQAPAGMTRGLISETGADTAIETKILMSDVEETETIATLYAAGINPIISGDDGLVLFGQRTTLNNVDSMMQRISIRRMVLDIRRYVKAVAKNILFEQNKEDVLKQFSQQITPILTSMLTRGGISRYKVVVDETTTSQADIEANIVRGKVFIQPNRSDEIIQVDFVT